MQVHCPPSPPLSAFSNEEGLTAHHSRYFCSTVITLFGPSRQHHHKHQWTRNHSQKRRKSQLSSAMLGVTQSNGNPSLAARFQNLKHSKVFMMQSRIYSFDLFRNTFECPKHLFKRVGAIRIDFSFISVLTLHFKVSSTTTVSGNIFYENNNFHLVLINTTDSFVYDNYFGPALRPGRRACIVVASSFFPMF